MNFILRLAFGLGRLSSWCKAKLGIQPSVTAVSVDEAAIPLSLSDNDVPGELLVQNSSEQKI
jgi:hypothetical protein